MDWLLSLLQDVAKTIASKAILQVPAVLAPTLLIRWLLAWWDQRSLRVKLLLGIGGFALLAALMVGVYLEQEVCGWRTATSLCRDSGDWF